MLIFTFCSRTLNNRINRLQERALRILYKDDDSTFSQLLEKDHSITLHTKNLQLLATEMYKMKNHILPCLLSEFVTAREASYNFRAISDFLPYDPRTVHLGTESLSFLGPKVWDLVPSHIKESSNLVLFRTRIKNWLPDNCPCRLCKVYISQLGFLT